MRAFLPWLLILLAVALGYWLFASDDELPGAYETAEDEAGGDPEARARGTGGMRGASEAEMAARKERNKKVWHPPDPRTLPKGVLIVKPFGPDLKPLIDRSMNLRLTPRGQRGPKQARFNESTGHWRFERVIAGSCELKVTGDHIIGRSVTVQVKADREIEYELHLEHAGALRYDVATYAKTRPKQVLIELFDATDVPAEAWFQNRSTFSLNQAIKTKARTQGPEGALFGIRPGLYKIKVTNVESEEWDEKEVEVKAGFTLPVSLVVRR